MFDVCIWGGSSQEEPAAEIKAYRRTRLTILAHATLALFGRHPHRIDNLRQADLSRVSTPRGFGGVLLARFDVRVDPLEQSELVSLLQDEVCALSDLSSVGRHYFHLDLCAALKAYFLRAPRKSTSNPPSTKPRTYVGVCLSTERDSGHRAVSGVFFGPRREQERFSSGKARTKTGRSTATPVGQWEPAPGEPFRRIRTE